MSKTDPNRYNRAAIILGLTMTLGPLTALSFGSKYAGEETLARAEAGHRAIVAREMRMTEAEGAVITSAMSPSEIGGDRADG